MTNDTNTLNGALTELGELMADNLVTMGVTDADASDGLTTLANRILDIEQGGSCKYIELTTDIPILSYADNESATLSASYKENGVGISGETIEFFKDSTSLGTATTDSNGIATMTYQSHISGNSTFTAKNGGVTSNSINIEEMWYFNDGTKLSNVTIGSGVSCTVTSDNTIRITTSSSGEKYVTYPPTFTNSDNFIIEFEIACTGSTQRTAFWLNNATTANGLWCCYEISQNKFSGGLRSSAISYSTSCSVGDVMKIKQENGTISIYKNDTEIISKETSFTSSTYQFGNYTNSSRVQCLKNIKVKAL